MKRSSIEKLLSRPAVRHTEQSQLDLPYNIVNIFNIPPDSTKREVRKLIGRLTYEHLSRDPPVRFAVELIKMDHAMHGKIIFGETKYAKKWIDIFGPRFTLHPILIDGRKLSFSPSKEFVDPFQIRAIQYEGSQEQDSDYEEDGDGRSHSSWLDLSKVDCGGFDDQGRFCAGWSAEAKSRASMVSFDIDEARLRIRCENVVVQALIYDIKYIYSCNKRQRLYFEFKQPPMLLKQDPALHSKDALLWLETAPVNFSRNQEKFQRVSSFDEVHAKCVQNGTVYRVHICGDEKKVRAFFDKTKGRLRMKGTVKELDDGNGNVFDSTEVDKMLEKLDFSVAFQAQALLGPNKLLPIDLISIRADILALQSTLGMDAAAAVLRNLKADLCVRGPLAKRMGWATFTMKQVKERLATSGKSPLLPTTLAGRIKKSDGGMLIHSVYLTPSYGIKLEGPHPDEGNRILRLYPAQEDNFIRVHLTEEDGSPFRVVYDYGSIDAEEMMHSRFGDAMRKGIMVAGRKFRFLAFSGSSLREHSCWFVRNFRIGKTKITASTIRDGIGELEHLRSPARYAARMGQAFTATSTSIPIAMENIEIVADIKTTDERYEFSDGVGTMSQEVCDRINAAIFADNVQRPTIPPTTFQIRMGGAKGMLSLDVRLKGEKVKLRESMVKFECKGSNGVLLLEIAHYYVKPVPTFLNRQMIALLESLGVPAENFLELQEDAIRSLGEATITNAAAIALLHRSGVGRGCNMEGILRSLYAVGINAVTAIPFLRDANMSLVGFTLRYIKYRARIRVPECYTLVGIMDEYGVLQKNQIIACINEPGKEPMYLKGRCLVGRSPMLAPGDVQYAFAIEPPKEHGLRAITNAIIFSQKGERPLPSMLSGGDLDGDLYNIIQHPDLMPHFTCSAADYAKPKKVELKRACTVDDVIDFLLDYIKMDKLGLIAIRHLEISDQRKDGMLDQDCLKLAAMHSVAVDFPKSGLLPEIKQMPRAPRFKPDYRKLEHRNEDRDLNKGKKHPRAKDIYYPSAKALGQLFRAIDVHTQIREWNQTSRQKSNGQERWDERLWEVLLQKERGGKWKGMVKQQMRLVEEYYSRLWVVAEEHSSMEKGARLDEEEVFMGHILCRGPNGSRTSRYDETNRLQDEFHIICTDTRKRALFDPSTLEDETGAFKNSVVPRWLSGHFGRGITMHDLMHIQMEQQEDLQTIQVTLHRALQRGLAWVRATFDTDPKRGRSAPWIVVPSLLMAHACLDTIEAFFERKDSPNIEDNESDNNGYDLDSSGATSPFEVSHRGDDDDIF